MSEPRTRVALPLIIAATALTAWWGWKQGAYFGPVFYPGAILLFALMGLIVAFAPFGYRIDGAARVALLALAGFAALTFLSTLWTPTPAAAVEYGLQASVYAVLFALGLWLAQQLRERALLALTPLAVAGAGIGIATVVVLATGTDVSWYLHEDATLRFPIGYRNADAAFFLICLWPLVGLGTWSKLGWAPRALANAMATLLLELAVLSQSRGSLPAVAIAFVVYLAFARQRLRAAIYVALVALPALAALPTLLEVFHYGKDTPGVVPLLRDSAKAILWTTIGSFLLSAVAIALVDPRVRVGEARVRALSWVSAVVAIVVVVGGAGVFVSHHGGPVKFADQRLDQFRKIGYPDLSSQGARFGANVGSNRHDFWRVSADEGLEEPLLGGGAGSFFLDYQLHRRSPETPHDPHSVEAMAFSELGFPGAILLAVFLLAAVVAAVRSRRSGPPAVGAALAAAAMAGAAQWLLQASYDWLWHYPAVTGSGIFLLGAAAGLGLRREVEPGGGRGPRAAAIVVLVALALAALPLFLSSRSLRSGETESESDPAAAVSDFQNAADLNPLAATPLILKGVVAADAGAGAVAIEALREAVSREPEYYLPHLLLARELQRQAPKAALVEATKALRLNPRERDAIALRKQIQRELARRQRGKGGAGSATIKP